MMFADECEESPCLNGGTCQNQIGTFTCGCRSHFAGPLCGECESGWIGAQCSAIFYFPYGPQTNVNEDKVTSGGWTKCHSESMDKYPPLVLEAIMRKCSKSQLILGCREVGSSTITLLAAAPNGKEALKITGDNGQIINGSKWYRRNGRIGNNPPYNRTGNSYGFVHESSEMEFQRPYPEVDSGATKAEMRLSYYLAGPGGWSRCGGRTKLYDNNGWEKLYYHAD